MVDVEKACHEFAELFAKAASEIGFECLVAEVHMEDEAGWNNDTCILIKEVVARGREYQTGYMISPVIEQEAQGLGGEQTDQLYYYVQHEEVTRGVYRYADGSGEPDTSDIVDDLKTEYAYKAIIKTINLYIEMTINHMFEAMAEEAYAKEVQEEY